MIFSLVGFHTRVIMCNTHTAVLNLIVSVFICCFVFVFSLDSNSLFILYKDHTALKQM